MLRIAILAGLVAATAATAATSAGEVPIIGSRYARGCFEAAEQRRRAREALRICDSALLDQNLAAGDRAATLVNRGIVQMQARNITAAIADYDAAIAARPETAEAWVNKGIALLQLGDRDADAVEAISQGIARDPSRPEVAYYSRAMAYEQLGRAREAYEDYSRAAQLAPAWDEPAEQLQRFQVVRGKTASG